MFMIIAAFLLLMCGTVSVAMLAAIRAPLLRTLMLSFDCWAESARTDKGHLN
ncbi:hypothetical protein G7077_09100 [Sphingomonas piscis]|uniref:Uncharacterized protein n=1 Tax=Sphingomonas piscis TaxID=2714943 RepID=A0A6G7YQL6_9SPHN|nr:hypothetical protein [Sphingomonas piscis]QIK79024.1 hypothetical protein G7077_09100 [Sphingomonas piscis]